MRNRMKKRAVSLFGAVLLTVFTALFTLSAYAAEKPEIAAQGAALYNASTGEFLFGKNENQQFYPASITKVMTALLVLENAGLDDVVTFTDSATKNLESGAVSLDVTAGDKIPVRDCLYGLLLKSANEVANGLAEHVAGSVPAFAGKMNEKAKALQEKLTANGRSESNLIYTADGVEDPDASRRVEVKFRLKDDEMIQELSEIIANAQTSGETGG